VLCYFCIALIIGPSFPIPLTWHSFVCVVGFWCKEWPLKAKTMNGSTIPSPSNNDSQQNYEICKQIKTGFIYLLPILELVVECISLSNWKSIQSFIALFLSHYSCDQFNPETVLLRQLLFRHLLPFGRKATFDKNRENNT
jgi:hypothetical protein